MSLEDELGKVTNMFELMASSVNGVSGLAQTGLDAANVQIPSSTPTASSLGLSEDKESQRERLYKMVAANEYKRSMGRA